MSELNPDKRIAQSEGVDRPVMYIYLAGRIAGNCIDKCLAWRRQIIDHYANYKGKGVYPIAFLDALNSKESDSVDPLGLTSAIPPNLIYDKDMMSVKKADVVVAYMDDYMEEGLEDLMNLNPTDSVRDTGPKEYCQIKDIDYKEEFFRLQSVIRNRRPNYGTTMEISWALWLQKPLILIAGDERRKKILESHPFTKRSSMIVKDVDELLKHKWINILYKSVSSAIY